MDKTKLVNVDEMAEVLGVEKSWIYSRTRFGQKAIPHIRVGKYMRFDINEVLEFLKNKENG